jgi:hypothetical protein
MMPGVGTRHWGSGCDGRTCITKLAEIEKAIAQLSAEDLAKLRDWLDEFESRVLDERIEHEARLGRDGKFAKLAAEALADHKAGRSRRL